MKHVKLLDLGEDVQVLAEINPVEKNAPFLIKFSVYACENRVTCEFPYEDENSRNEAFNLFDMRKATNLAITCLEVLEHELNSPDILT